MKNKLLAEYLKADDLGDVIGTIKGFTRNGHASGQAALEDCLDFLRHLSANEKDANTQKEILGFVQMLSDRHQP